MRTVIAALMMLAACSSAPQATEAFERLQWQVAGDESAQPITLAFDAKENRASGFSGCNRYSGSYTLDHNQLRFGAMMSTKMACADDARNRTEQQFLEALAHVDSYAYEQETLTLYDANAAQLLRFRAMPADVSTRDAR